MKQTKRKIWALLLCLAVCPNEPRAVAARDKTNEPMQEVMMLAHAIRAVQPDLRDAEAVAYAIGIRRAANEFKIQPSLLIAITQMESGFRPNLPEGPAGEIGICQILKSWLNNPKLVARFGRLRVSDLRRPATSFRIAAWILHDLKQSGVDGPLPYWSFYNSRAFKPRLKYFLRVSQRLNSLRQNAPMVYNPVVLMAASDLKERRERMGARRPASTQAMRASLRTTQVSRRQLRAQRLIQTAGVGLGSMDYSKTVLD